MGVSCGIFELGWADAPGVVKSTDFVPVLELHPQAECPYCHPSWWTGSELDWAAKAKPESANSDRNRDSSSAWPKDAMTDWRRGFMDGLAGRHSNRGNAGTPRKRQGPQGFWRFQFLGWTANDDCPLGTFNC